MMRHTPFAKITDFGSGNDEIPETDIINGTDNGFKEALAITISEIQKTYPDAKIYLCTLTPFRRLGDKVFPMNNTYHTMQEYNKTIKKIADYMGCNIIDFSKCWTFYNCLSGGYVSPDYTHPVQKGHRVMCEQAELTPEEMSRRADRILRKMDDEGISDKKLRKTVEKVKSESSPKMQEYEDKLETLGERNSYSKTDPDATFMRMKEDAMNNGQTKPGYNIQIATENQFITNYGIFCRPTDQGTLIPFLTSFSDRYGMQSDEVCADSGYGSEQNYAHMFGSGIVPYVKYNMFHAEEHRKYKNNPFLTQNMFYNKDEDYYVCPMGQHLEHIGDVRSKSDLGYESTVSRYRAQDCTACPLRGMCCKGISDRRTIEVNHQANAYKAEAKRLLTSERGLHHRSNRPIEPEAVFGDIKQNHGFKRFRLKSNVKVKVEFGLVALAHNLRKYIAMERMRSRAVSSCL